MDIPKTPETLETTSAPEEPGQGFSWIKKNILLIILFVLLIIFVVNKLNRFESVINESIILPNVYLDFQNKSGAARIRSSFTDILVGSDGSIKKGDGYEIKLNIINPSSVTLNNIRCEFRYSSSSMPVIYEDINLSISPGRSKIVKCFISDLSDYDLKSIEVSVKFDQVHFYQQ
jgi:hypothetical protein